MAYQKKLPPPPRYADEPHWRGNSFDVGSRLVRQAWNMIFTKDPSTISLREVAQAVGVSAPAAYNHFKDRDHLFSEIAGGALNTLSREIGETWPDKQLRAGLLPGTCEVWLRFAEKRPNHYALMFAREFNDSERHPMASQERNVLKLFLRALVATELGFEPPAAEADVIFTLLHGAGSLIASGEPKPQSKVLLQAIADQLAGMKKRRR